MNDLIKKIKAGIDSYKKVFPKKYQFIKGFVDPAVLAIAISKIESNFNYKASGKGGEYGLFQFMPATLTATIKSYTKNITASKKLFYAYPNSQTFVFMQLLYLNLKSLNSRGGKLNKDYEKLISVLPIGDQNLVRAAILHNQGTSALSRQSTNYNPMVFYVPQLLGTLRVLKPNASIQSATMVNGVWQVASLAFPQLRAAGIIGKLAVAGMGAYIAYNANLKTSLPEMIAATNASYRQALQDRFKTIWLAKGSPEAEKIDKELKDEDHPLLDKPGGGSSNNKPPKEKKEIPWIKIGVGTGAAATGKGVGDGTEKLLDKVGEGLKNIPEKATNLLSNPMFLAAGIGIVYLITKKK
jgi:hypothetical protein